VGCGAAARWRQRRMRRNHFLSLPSALWLLVLYVFGPSLRGYQY
jgi:hypothetical protein